MKTARRPYWSARGRLDDMLRLMRGIRRVGRIDSIIPRAIHHQNARRAFGNSPQCMIYQRIVPRFIQLEFKDGHRAGRHVPGFLILNRRIRRTAIHLVKNFANHVKV